jgi:UDP-N-acetylmuramyl tripeptide synthase
MKFTIIIAKLIAFLSKSMNIGSGATWPGEFLLRIYPQILVDFVKQLDEGIVLVTGTNGKTTTTKIIETLIKDKYNKKHIVTNNTGANLMNGLVSAFVLKTKIFGRFDARIAIFEVDEAELPNVIEAINFYRQKIVIVCLNLFRDQLDRYGEVDTISKKWQNAFSKLKENSYLILNSDDPQITILGNNKKSKIKFFGINDPNKLIKKQEHATDSIYCPNCMSKLNYTGYYFSHLGIWQCGKCNLKQPNNEIINLKIPMAGFYNKYNFYAAYLVAKIFGIEDDNITRNISLFTPAFGRQEEIILNEKKIKILLSKNPAGFNASLRTIIDLKAKTVIIALNDRIPDGRDVSWIWDVDFEILKNDTILIATGDRAFDMGIRLKYSLADNNLSRIYTEENLKKAIHLGLKNINKGQTLYILPTYSAMLDIRNLLLGKKIL